MWGWDLNQEEAPIAASSPKILPTNAASSSSATVPTQPVVVPNVETLKEQFQQQESMLAHIRETLRENDADLSTKEKQLEMYATKLSQIKSRSKGKKKPGETDVKAMAKALSNENSAQLKDGQVDNALKTTTSKGKMSELKKRLEENKKQFEEHTEKGMSEAKKIECMVEQLRTQVLERDVTIHELQKSIETPTPPRPKVQTLPRRNKDKPLATSKWTQTFLLDEGEARIKELEATIVDLQDTVKQQASVIVARTKAVALLSEDLSKKGKSTVDELEDVRREMREMQAKFIAVETELKSSLVERDNRLLDLDKELQAVKTDNAQLLEKNIGLAAELESRQDVCLSVSEPNTEHTARIEHLEKKVDELTKELDDSNKLMIRLKLEHKNKLKAANKSLGKLKQGSDEKTEILKLSAKIDELIGEKENLESKITELEEEKASFSARCSDWQSLIDSKDAEICDLKTRLIAITEENQALTLNIEDQNILIDNLHVRINNTDTTNVEPFVIPGDAASLQFDTSNQHVQTEIEGFVREKQDLLDKLKNLSSSLEATEPEITASTQSQVGSQFQPDVTALEEELKKEKARVAELEAKLSQLEKPVEKTGSKAMNTLKNKLKKMENDLKKEKAVIDELNNVLKRKDELIDEMNRKLFADTADNSWESEALETTQKKCLALESSLLQVTEQCEHLRKENIEVVHQLSGEKVRRIRAEEEAEAVRAVFFAAQELEVRVTNLEASELPKVDAEYANVVIAGKDTEIFNLQSSLADKTQALDRIEEELKVALAAAEDLRKALTHRDNEVQLLRTQLDEAESRIKNFEGDIAQLKDQLSEDERKVSEVLVDLQAKSRDHEALRLDYHKLQAALDFATVELADERAKNVEMAQSGGRYVEEIKKQHNEALIRCEESEKVLQKTWEERNDLIQSQDRSYQQIAEMERQLTELTASYRELSQIHAGCRSQLETTAKGMDSKDAELENMKKELTAKKQELESLTVKAKKLAVNLKKKTQIEKELQDLVNSLKNEGEILSRQLSSSDEIIQEKNKKIQELVDEQASLAGNNMAAENIRLEETMQEIQNLRDTIDALQKENTQLYSNSELLVQQIKEMEAIISEMRENRAASDQKLEAVLSENNLLKDKLSQFEENLVMEKNEKDRINELNKKISNEFNALQMAFELEEKENETLLSQKTQLMKEMENYSATVAKLQHENENFSKELERLESDCQVLLSDKTHIEQELADKIAQVVSYEERINGLLQSTEGIIVNSSKLQEEIDKINQEKINLLEQLGQFRQWEEKYNLIVDEKVFLENEKNQLVASFECRLADSQAIIDKLKADEEVLREKLRLNDEDYALNIAQLEKQINNFHVAFDAEVCKNAALKQETELLKSQISEIESSRAPEKAERKKKKSVTFNTEDADYIKELRGEVASLQRALVESDATVGELKAALEEKPETTSETTVVGLFDAPPTGNFFDQFPNQEASDPFAEDSLQWDDSWGTEGQLEAEHAISKASEENSEKIVKLESELKHLYGEKESVQEELRVLQVKYAKVIKKLKEQKLIIDRLQGEAKKNAGFGDLEAEMIEAMRAEMAKVEKRESDLKKDFESLQQENANLLKKIDVLNAGNEKYMELKERQTNDAAVWQNQQAELRTEIADLKAQLLEPVDDSTLTHENRELKNLIEALEWKVSELTEMIDEKEEELTQISRPAPQIPEQSSCNNCQASSERLLDVQQQLETLVTENEDLQEFIRKEMGKPKTVAETAPSLSEFFPAAAVNPFDTFTGSAAENPVEDLKALKNMLNQKDFELEKARSLEEELKNLLQSKEDKIEELRNGLESIQRNVAKPEIESQLGADNPSEEELAQLRQAFEVEKMRYESIIKARDLELKTLQDALGSTERDWDETQGHNDDVIQQLKAQLRELDSTAARSIEDKEVELQELRAQCEELRELCKSREDNVEHLRRELVSLSNSNASNGEEIRIEYETKLAAANEALREKSDELNWVRNQLEQQEVQTKLLKNASDELLTLQKRLAAKESEFSNLLQQSSSIEAELLSRDAEARELRAELLTKDAELREIRSDMQGLRTEVMEIQNFDRQLRDMQKAQTSDGSQVAAPGWNMQDSDDLCARLQSDLDATLYHLHQRDVRCDELTLELTQLLEERDVLQLRLSTVIRQNEEMRMAVNAANASSSSVSASPSDPDDGNMRHLAEKISELHTVGYKRDKNFQDESQQRHREQMALLGREAARGKATKSVFDI